MLKKTKDFKELLRNLLKNVLKFGKVKKLAEASQKRKGKLSLGLIGVAGK